MSRKLLSILLSVLMIASLLPVSAFADTTDSGCIDELGHEYGEWVVTTESTCTVKGTETRTCSRCNAVETRELPLADHFGDNGICSSCGYVDPDTHEHVLNYERFEGSCTEPSYSIVSCVCGYSEMVDVEPAPGHCYVGGSCERCGAEDPNRVAAPTVKITTSAGKPKLSWNAVDGAVKYDVYRSTNGKKYSVVATTTELSYTDSKAKIGTTYYYMVASGDANDVSSEMSEVKSIQCKPAAPTITISRVDGKAKLSWKAVTGASKYYIYRSTDGKTYEYRTYTTRLAYTDSKAAANTKYYYKVKSVAVVNDKNVLSAYSNAKSLTTSPAAPAIKLTTVNGKPKISWAAVTGAAKYEIYRSTDGKKYSLLVTTTKLSYTNTGAKAGTTYYYKVKAVSAAGAKSMYSAAKSIMCKPAAPYMKTSRVDGKPKLSWAAVSGADKYWIYRSTDEKTYKLLATTTKTSYVDTATTAATPYYYKIKAVKVVNGKNVASSYSNSDVVWATTKAPTLKITTSAGKPKITWSKVDGANMYWVFFSTDGKTFYYAGETKNTSYVDKNAVAGTKYYYKVQAVKLYNGTFAVASDYSKAVSIKATK